MDRYSDMNKANIAGILGNVFLLIIKFIVGFLSNSQAMIADAANSAGDIFASLMSSIGSKIANNPEDETAGIHTITWNSEADEISITHSAHSRRGFALGAVLAAEFTATHHGLLSTDDLFQWDL